MAQNFKIDQQGTFAGPLLMIQCTPKCEFGSEKQQTLKDGTPKWEAHLLGMFHGFGGAIAPEIMKVGIAQHGDPSEGIAPQTPVILPGLEVGVMEKTKKLPSGEEKIIGVTVWHRADSMHPATAPAQQSSTPAASAPSSARGAKSTDEKEKQPA